LRGAGPLHALHYAQGIPDSRFVLSPVFFEKTGLVAVWQALSPERRPPLPSVAPDKPTAPKPAEPVAKQPQVVVDAPPVEDAYTAKYACGIINARGERLLDLPGQFAQAISENKQERFWKFYEDPTRVYWVNVVTGRVCRE
jgi:hypothetical protein